MSGDLRDVPGLAVGHFTDPRRPTGCTVVLCPPGTRGGVDVRGGAPGTRETDLLRPGATVDVIHAVLLTGGSAFGLDAAGGVMRFLEAAGQGVAVGPARVPIVSAAVLFDLWVGDPAIRPDAQAGWTACQAALRQGEGLLAQGNVGAGAGATVGKMLGPQRAMKGGLGSVSLRCGAHTVAALVAVNAVGDVWDAAGQLIAGARSADGQRKLGCLAQAETAPPLIQTQPGSATTLAVVATDAPLSKTQTQVLAQLAHHGLSRAIDPITPHDGDTVFALATGDLSAAPAGVDSSTLSLLGACAAQALAAAIRRGVLEAHSLPDHQLPAARDLP